MTVKHAKIKNQIKEYPSINSSMVRVLAKSNSSSAFHKELTKLSSIMGSCVSETLLIRSFWVALSTEISVVALALVEELVLVQLFDTPTFWDFVKLESPALCFCSLIPSFLLK